MVRAHLPVSPAVTPASRGRRAGRQPGTGGHLTQAGFGPRHLPPHSAPRSSSSERLLKFSAGQLAWLSNWEAPAAAVANGQRRPPSAPASRRGGERLPRSPAGCAEVRRGLPLRACS